METSILVKLKALACKFNTSKTPLRVFFTFLKLYRWYQIVQSIIYTAFGTRPNLNPFSVFSFDLALAFN